MFKSEEKFQDFLESLRTVLTVFVLAPILIFTAIKNIFYVIFSKSRKELIQEIIEFTLAGVMFILLVPVLFIQVIMEVKNAFSGK